MKVISLVNKKGGVGKTTTAVGCALGFRSRGLRVGLVDTDPNGSAARWSESLELDMVPCLSSDLGPLLDGIRDDYDVVLVDTPPNDEAAIATVAGLSDLVLIPIAPSAIEVDQLPDTVVLVEQASTPWVVVPVRVRMSTTSGRTIRELCERSGVAATRAIVPLQERIAASFGEELPPVVYAALVDELAGLMAVPA